MRAAVALLDAERARLGEELKRLDGAIGERHRHERAVVLRKEAVEIGQAIGALNALIAAYWPQDELEWALAAVANGATRGEVAEVCGRSLPEVTAALPTPKALRARARQSEVLEHGLSNRAAARVLGVTARTIQRRAKKAREQDAHV